jgi:predicted DNA-binding protein
MGGDGMTQYSDQEVTAAAAAFARGEVAYDETAHAQLPPVPEAEPMVPLGIRVSPALAQRIRDAADHEGKPYSQLVREWIEVGLTEMLGDQVLSLSALRRAIAHAAQSGQAA